MRGLRQATSLQFVQFLTLARIGGALAFAAVALQPAFQRIAIILYIGTLMTDMLDGRLARMLRVESEFGAAFDGVADKYVSIVSTLFLAALGLPLVACCLILVRDVVVQGLRIVRVEGAFLFPLNRRVGAASGLPVRILTMVALLDRAFFSSWLFMMRPATWLVAVVSLSSLAYSIFQARERIAQSLDINA